MPDDHVFRRDTGVLTGPFVARRIAGGLSGAGGEDGEIAIGDVDGLQTALDGKAATTHTHEISNVTGLQAALDGKAASSHTHSISNVTGLQSALDGKAATTHTHSIANVNGLQLALDGKAASSHTHSIANVTGLQSALDGKAAASHTHTPASLGAAEVLNSAWPGYIRIVSGSNAWHVEATQVVASVTEITGMAGNGEVELTCNWPAFGDIEIYRSTSNTFSGATLLTTVASTSHIDTTVANDTTYYYWFVHRVGDAFSEPNASPLEVTTGW